MLHLQILHRFLLVSPFEKNIVFPAMVLKFYARDPGMKNNVNFETKTIRNQKTN